MRKIDRILGIVAIFGLLGMRLCAVPLFDATQLKAEQGDAQAQFNLGVRYRLGEGVLKDAKEAARWVRKAAEQGHATGAI